MSYLRSRIAATFPRTFVPFVLFVLFVGVGGACAIAPEVNESDGETVVAQEVIGGLQACTLDRAGATTTAGIAVFGGCETIAAGCALLTGGVCLPVSIVGQPVCLISGLAAVSLAWLGQVLGITDPPSCGARTSAQIQDAASTFEGQCEEDIACCLEQLPGAGSKGHKIEVTGGYSSSNFLRVDAVMRNVDVGGKWVDYAIQFTAQLIIDRVKNTAVVSVTNIKIAPVTGQMDYSVRPGVSAMKEAMRYIKERAAMHFPNEKNGTLYRNRMTRGYKGNCPQRDSEFPLDPYRKK
jgi:hypothetical protein